MKRILRSLAAACIAAGSVHAALDLNNDNVPDVWGIVYNVGAIDMSADPDGDGLTNAQEAIAGTDPFSPNGTIKIRSITVDQYGVHLVFPAAAGKRYQVQSASSLDTPTWANEGAALAGVDGDLTANYDPTGATNKFYRVVVSDLDSDGDGVSDWEEIKLGFDPNNSHSGGASGPDDLTAITGALTTPSVVSVTAGDDLATEPSAGSPATDTGSFVVTRTGGLKPITVQYTTSGPATAGSDYAALPGSVTFGLGVKSVTIPVVPLADAVTESPEAVLLNLVAGAGYTIGGQTTAGVIIQDWTTANGTGLSAAYYNEANTISTTVPPTFSNRVLTRTDATVNFDYTVAAWPGSPVTATYFASRWTGEVMPEFSQIYTFYTNVNLGGRLWVNGQLLVNNWPHTGYAAAAAEYSGTIELQAGVRYPVIFEQYETTGNNSKAILSWASANQSKQVIPTTRLFPNAAPQIFEPLTLLLIKDSGATTYQVNASGSPTAYSAANLPPGWTINANTGLISGSPTQAGEWDIPLTATNANGSGSAILHLTVLATGGAITRDEWTGNYATLADVPFGTAPTSSAMVTSLEGPQTSNVAYGSRLRGYITAPLTGVYQFWLTGDDDAQLWISDDDEPVNAISPRAELTVATAYRDWANAAKSPLLYLKAGLRYYVEVRHKDSAASGHVSIGWLKPGQTGTVPSEVVPGYVLSPWVPPTATSTDGTLYVTALGPQGTSLTSGYGNASLQLTADEKQAVLIFSYSNLTTPVTGEHIHSDSWQGHGSQIIFDIDEATPRADGSYLWDIQASGVLTAANIVQIIKDGAAYLNIHTAQYPGGEIRGNFTLATGSQTFTPPPAPPSWTDDHSDAKAASRFLAQATFGASPADITAVQSMGYEAWIDDQFTKAATHHYDFVFANRNTTTPSSPTYPTSLEINSWWKNSITAPDQLRQRVAFAFSQIQVISSSGVLEDIAHGHADYYDTLLDGSFGNFRDLIENVTLHPMMGLYLDMRKNDKPDKTTGRIPNENYAREILQLFTIGLNRLHPDGSLVLNSKGLPVPTYDQDAIIGFAHAFTGWNYNQANQANGKLPSNWSPGSDYLNPMKEVPGHHFTGQKRILNNVVLPGLPTIPSLGNQVLDPYAVHTTTQIESPEYQALPAQELDGTHDAIFKHPNAAPFICRQLIQRLVTSTPSRGYIYRVVQKFEDNGSGVRGDLKAVIKAILLDYEARSPVAVAGQGYGKQREPALRLTGVARAFPPSTSITGNYTQDGGVIAVTTDAPHRLASGNPVNLAISTGTPVAATGGSYTLSGSFPIPTNGFSVRTKDCFRSTYVQDVGSNTVTITTPSGHGFSTGLQVYVRFRDGTDKPADGFFPVTVVNSTSFTVTVPTTPAAKINAANCDVHYLKGGYTQSGTAITVTTTTRHGLATGANVYLTFALTSGSVAPANGLYPITVVDEDTFTAVSANSASTSGNIVAGVQFPDTTAATAVLNRTGPLTTAYSDWSMGNTDTDLAQTPLRSPTVFNFFLPDYQFPGTLATAGLVTPEFQLTSDTNVIRQVNTLYNGIFNPSGTTSGLSSFRSGAGDIAIDLGPWMQNGPGGVPWTNDVNLNALVDSLNNLLMAGQLSSTGTNNYGTPRVIVNAKQAIYDYVTHKNTSGTYDNITYNNTTPSDTNKRDRIRAVVHLLVTSPDFTIQK